MQTFIALAFVVTMWFIFELWIESSGFIRKVPDSLNLYYKKDTTMKVRFFCISLISILCPLSCVSITCKFVFCNRAHWWGTCLTSDTNLETYACYFATFKMFWFVKANVLLYMASWTFCLCTCTIRYKWHNTDHNWLCVIKNKVLDFLFVCWQLIPETYYKELFNMCKV